MALYYNLFLTNNEPVKPPNLAFWLKPDIGQAFMRVNDRWTPVIGGNPIASFVEGTFYRELYVQAAEPVPNLPGDIWLNTDINQAFMLFEHWQPFAGA